MAVNPAVHRTGGLERRRLVRKSVLDRSVAGLLLLLTGAWMLLIAVTVRLDTPGPVFCRERRLGRDGRPFWLLSFRCSVLEVAPGEDRGPGEGRVQVLTSTGRVLRGHGLDRLPRLLNVLRGDMSLVGPPPQLPWAEDDDEIEPAWLPIRPGLVGIGEVRRRHGGRRSDPVDLADYVRHYSVGRDLAVLGRAVRTALTAGSAR